MNRTNEQTKTMQKYIRHIVIVLFSLLSSQAYGAQITVTSDFNPVLLSDSFHLTFEATGSVDDEPDFSPLEKDFDILGRSQSSNISIINGDYKRSTKWTLSLMARQAGVITIPSISFGKDRSPQMQITVKQASAATNSKSYGTNKSLMLELEADKKQTWVQGQLIVTLRLLSSKNLNSYRFSDLKINDMDAVTEVLGKVKQYKTYRGNTPYLVLEQRYALFPQEVGQLHINPMIAEVDIIKSSRSNSFFDPFGRSTQTRRIRSQGLDINVKGIPPGFKGQHWLPANEIQLVEEWPDNAAFKVGEPVTRTLSLLADGLTSAQLPELSLKEIDGLKQYPDQPSLHDNKKADGVIGIREEKVALIPTRKGKITIPAIELPWWNVKTGKMEVARLPAKTIHVMAGSNISQHNTGPASQTPVMPQTSMPQTPAGQATAPAPQAGQTNQLWFYLSWAFASAWLLTLLAWWITSRKKTITQPLTRVEPDLPSVKPALNQLKKACKANNAAACKDALILWGQAVLQQPSLHNLGELSQRVNEPLRSKIAQLNQYLYSGQQGQWQAGELVELCQKYQPEPASRSSDASPLEPLYKAG